MKKLFILISILMLILLISSCSGEKKKSTSTTVKADTNASASWKFQVFMYADASEDEIEEIEQAIKDYVDEQDKASYEFRDKKEALLDAQEAFADDPEMLSTLSIEEMTSDFLITIYSENKPLIGTFVDELHDIGGVQKITYIERIFDQSNNRNKNNVKSFKLEIFLDVNATDTQIDALITLLETDKESGLVAKITFISKQDASKIFNEMVNTGFAFGPDGMDLPVSFVVTPSEPSASGTSTLEAKYSSIDGVYGINTIDTSAKDFFDKEKFLEK